MPRWPPSSFSPPRSTATGTTPSGHDSPQTDAVVRAQALCDPRRSGTHGRRPLPGPRRRSAQPRDKLLLVAQASHPELISRRSYDNSDNLSPHVRRWFRSGKRPYDIRSAGDRATRKIPPPVRHRVSRRPPRRRPHPGGCPGDRQGHERPSRAAGLSEPPAGKRARHVLAGALDFMSTSGVNQTVVPVGGINAVGFAFDDYSKGLAAMDGVLGAYVRAQFEKVGLHVFEKVLDNGFRNITTGAKPINAPEDLKGLKIRVPGNQLWVTMFNALGAAPTLINFGELYAALQTRIVDGQENPLALISSSKLYEVQKYIALTGHIWDGHYIFTNGKKWTAMPEEVRAAITKGLTEAALKEREGIQRLNAELVASITKAGVTFNTPDKKPFRDVLKTAGFYADWKGKFGAEPWARLEKYTAPL